MKEYLNNIGCGFFGASSICLNLIGKYPVLTKEIPSAIVFGVIGLAMIIIAGNMKDKG